MKKEIKEFLYGLKNRGKSVETCMDESIQVYHKSSSKVKPLRILYAALQFDYNKPRFGFSYEENNFFHSLYNMGHEVIRFDFGQLRRRYGLTVMNKILLETVFRYNPDVMFFVIVNDKISGEVLKEITDNTRTITINFNSDDHWRFDNFTRFWADKFNWNITTHYDSIEKYRNIGYESVIYSQWACNHYLYRPLKTPKLYDVTFIGQPHGIRRDFIEKLTKAGIKVDIWGSGWGNGRVSLMEMVKIYNQSKINLNISTASTSNVNQIKGRDFEVPGTGSFLLTGHSEELTHYYKPGQDIETYQNVDEAIDKIRYYLKNEAERESIASNGLTATLQSNTYEIRFNKIFENCGAIRETEKVI